MLSAQSIDITEERNDLIYFIARNQSCAGLLFNFMSVDDKKKSLDWILWKFRKIGCWMASIPSVRISKSMSIWPAWQNYSHRNDLLARVYCTKSHGKYWTTHDIQNLAASIYFYGEFRWKIFIRGPNRLFCRMAMDDSPKPIAGKHIRKIHFQPSANWIYFYPLAETRTQPHTDKKREAGVWHFTWEKGEIKQNINTNHDRTPK